MKTIYICSDSANGIFSGIYDAWRAGGSEDACGIALLGAVEQQLFCNYAEVEETKHKVAAVERMILKNMGQEVYRYFYYALQSCDMEKGDAILGTMLAAKGLPDASRIMEHLSHPKVEKVFELKRSVSSEAHSFQGFLRFRELKSGVLYAQIRPKNQVLPCLAPHFSNRFPLENWMIYDSTNQMFVVHEAGKQWVMVQDEQAQFDDETLAVSEKERLYENLWKGYFSSISIKERENTKLQAQHLPLQYRREMPEFSEKSDAPVLSPKPQFCNRTGA